MSVTLLTGDTDRVCEGPGRLLELETETERLSDLLAVMEMREEQLVGRSPARRRPGGRLRGSCPGDW